MSDISSISVRALPGANVVYARNLAILLGLPLRLVVPKVPAGIQGGEIIQARGVLRAYVDGKMDKEDVSIVTEGEVFPEDTLFIDQNAPKCDNSFPAIASMNETVPNLRGGRILVPFGDGQASVPALRCVIQLAKSLGRQFEIVFWHTTYRSTDPELATARLWDHMMPEARATLDVHLIPMWERMVGLTHHFFVESVVSVSDGIIDAAYRHKCALIAMARGKQVLRGGYPKAVLDNSPIPVLIAPKQN